MFFWIFLLASVPLFAQGAPTNQQVDVKVNFTNLQFGKPFTVDFSAPPPIVQILSVDTNTGDGGQTSVVFAGSDGPSFRIQASAYSVRPYDFPSLRVRALDDAGNTNEFYTPPFTVPISNAMAADTNALKLADIEPAPFVWNHLWTIFMIAGAAALAFLVYFLRFRKPGAAKPQPRQDPFILLQRRLKALKARKYALNAENYKDFFVELSDLTREFLSLTVAPLAMESPTREILDILKKHRAPERVHEAVRQLLRTCDAAKYAKAVFPQERIDEALSLAEALWKDTPRPADPKENP